MTLLSQSPNKVETCQHSLAAWCWMCAPEGAGPSWWREVDGYGSRRAEREARLAPVNRVIYVESVDPYWYSFCPFINSKHSEDRWRVKFIRGAVVYCGAHLPDRYRDRIPD